MIGKKNSKKCRLSKKVDERFVYKNADDTVQIKTRLLVSGRSPECSDCFLRFMEQY